MILPLTRLALPVLLVLAAAALAGCETTGVGAKPEAAKPVEPPMTRTRAAEQCWMATEKGNAGLALDKRADVVDKCIEQKMKAAAAPPAS
jgi:type IV pilus biogenesis protein CpaD/CtpE